jgi:hypothetical protein
MNITHDTARFVPPPRMMRNLMWLAALGAAVSLAGTFLAPERAWPNILIAAYFLAGLGCAGAFLIAGTYITNAGWIAAIRRVPEAMTAVLPVAAVLFFVVLVGSHTIYSWTDTAKMAHDEVLSSKTWWLNLPFWGSRIAIYFGLWILCSWALVRNSRKQDASGDVVFTQRNRALAAMFLVVLGITFSLASFDWMMSLEPKWYSTIFGLYNISGMIQSGVAAAAVLVILLKRLGPLKRVLREEHLHDLGKLLFAMSTFWMYLWFCQYMLIWYANIPEETTYLLRRQDGAWALFLMLLLVFNWAVPFISLLPKWSKRREGVVLRVALIVLVGRWMDIAWMTLPTSQAQPAVGVWEIAPVLTVVCLFLLVSFRAFSRVNSVPVGDPMLAESRHYHS